MKKKVRKVLAFALSILMIFSALPVVNVFAETEIIATGNCSGDDESSVVWTYDSSGTLTISGTVKMWYNFYDKPWAKYVDSIDKVVVSAGVTNIGGYAFTGLTLKSADIANTVVDIGTRAFNNCKISEINIPDSVETLGNEAFANSRLINVTIPGSIKNISYRCFYNCICLKNVTILNGVEKILKEAFLECYQLININIPASVTSIGEKVFSGCSELSNIEISDNVKNIGASAFSGCGKLKSFKIPKGLTEISNGTFDHCGIEKVDIPENVKTIGENAFGHCSNIETLIIPDTVTDVKMNAFQHCYGLKEVHVSNSLKLKRIDDGVFRNCVNLEKVYLPQGIMTICSDAFSWCRSIKELFLPYSITGIFEGAFQECRSLVNVDYGGSQAQWEKQVTVYDNNDYLLNALNFNNKRYNLNDETYSFINYTDPDSSVGHCFGMSVTSSAYYLNLLERPSEVENTYALHDNETTKAPICYYQNIQGSYEENAIVAGGYYFKHHKNLVKKYDIDSDWQQAIDYVKDHSHDEKGDLIIDLRQKNDKILQYSEILPIKKKAHAVNFLYFKVVNGQERIYIYDSNNPYSESYIYKDSYGSIREEPFGIDGIVKIDGIAIVDVEKYLESTINYKVALALYGHIDSILVDCLNYSPMSGDIGDGDYYMFEFADDVTEVEIIPLKDNAEFVYMGKTYNFGKIDENTIGILKLAETDDDTAEVEFKITEKEDEKPTDPTPPPAEPTKPCDCKCHSSGFSLFIWKIGNFFHKIFKMDKYYECACGEKHW